MKNNYFLIYICIYLVGCQNRIDTVIFTNCNSSDKILQSISEYKYLDKDDLGKFKSYIAKSNYRFIKSSDQLLLDNFKYSNYYMLDGSIMYSTFLDLNNNNCINIFKFNPLLIIESDTLNYSYDSTLMYLVNNGIAKNYKIDEDEFINSFNQIIGRKEFSFTVSLIKIFYNSETNYSPYLVIDSLTKSNLSMLTNINYSFNVNNSINSYNIYLLNCERNYFLDFIFSLKNGKIKLVELKFYPSAVMFYPKNNL